MQLLYTITATVMPIIIFVFAIILCFVKGNLLDSFEAGVKEGLSCSMSLLPSLLLVMCAVSALFSSGAVDILCRLFKPLLSIIGVNEQMLPTIILRPFSGSGVTAIADKLFCDFGPDSSLSKTASILMGSTDTIIYTLCMYFSAAGIKKTRYAIPASFIVFIFSIMICVRMGNRML